MAYSRQLNFDVKNPQVIPMHSIQLIHPMVNVHWARSWVIRELDPGALSGNPLQSQEPARQAGVKALEEASRKTSFATISLACKGRQNISGKDASKRVAQKTLKGRPGSQALAFNQWKTMKGSTFEEGQDQISCRAHSEDGLDSGELGGKGTS